MNKLGAGAGLVWLVLSTWGCSGSHSGSAQSDAGSPATTTDAGNGCVPSTTVCGDGGVWSCNGDGTPAQLSQHCSSDQFCLEKSGTATCSATACFAGDRVCAGTVATECKPDGSGPKPGGDDCALSKQVCYAGECRDLLCTPGQKLCDNSSVYLCGDAGTSRTVVTSCSALEVCDADAGACKPKLCDPGKLGCDATRVVTCNAGGTGYLQSGPDCAAKGGVCIAGACQPAACTPGQGFCKDNDAYSCSGDGTSASLTNNCGPGALCKVSGSSAYCDYYYCPPNALGCNDNVLSTCNVDGSDWLPGGTDCTFTNASCIDDKCSPNQCPPNALFCKNGNVQQCDGQGLTFSQAQFCAIGTYCALRSGSATCAATPCSPDTDGCAGEKFGHCTADGLGVGAGATDCGAAKQVCTLQGCAKTAIDTISAPMQLGTAGANEVIANVIDVDSARKLTLIEANLSMAAPRTLVWAVYVQTNADGQGEFDLEYQKSTLGSGSGFQSSGAINVALQAGKTYAIGVAASDGGFVYYYDTPPVPPSLNFAHVTGSIDSGFGPQLDYSPGTEAALYVTRLTTTPPAP